jgi:hypothetical protein
MRHDANPILMQKYDDGQSGCSCLNQTRNRGATNRLKRFARTLSAGYLSFVRSMEVLHGAVLTRGIHKFALRINACNLWEKTRTFHKHESRPLSGCCQRVIFGTLHEQTKPESDPVQITVHPAGLRETYLRLQCE